MLNINKLITMWWWTIVILFVCLVLECKAQDPIVVLRQGTVRGIKMYTDTRIAVNAFLGIPYVNPPVGPLRFASPERHRGWNSTFIASSFGPACPQLLTASMPGVSSRSSSTPGVASHTETSEDCLFVNVWAPELAAGGYRGFPVVIILEGDGFVNGWPGRFPGHELASEGVVVVSASYRLNILGFFSLGLPEARGNMGLLDQYLALLWVRENVAAFGGDPGSVTLLGHGAGAASALLHATSPRTKGLFQRVIAMSGSPLAPWAGGSRGAAPVLAASLELARNLGCFSASATQTLACLRIKSTADLLRAFHNQYKGGNWSQIPLPITDAFLPEGDRYLPFQPKEALHRVSVPVLMGVTANDGVAALASWGELAQQGYEQLLQFAERAAIPALTVQAGLTRRSATVREMLSFHYLTRARNGDAEALLAQLIQLYSDAQYKAPNSLTATILTESMSSAPLYLYNLGTHPALPGSDLVYHSGINTSGAAHGTDMVLILGPGLLARALGRRLSTAEDRLSSSIKRLWVDFIRHGNPTPGAYGYGVSWRRYMQPEGNIFMLETQHMRAEPLAAPGEALWNSLLPRLDSLPPELAEQQRKVDTEGGELRDDGTSQTYRSTTFALGAVALVLAALLALSLVLLRRRTARHRDAAEDAF